MSSFDSVNSIKIVDNKIENETNNNYKNNNIKNNNNNNNNNNSKYSISSKGLLNILNFSSKISSLNENKTNLSLPFVSFYPFYPKLNVNLNLYTQSSFSFLNDLNLTNENFSFKTNENNNKESKEILTEYENMLNRIYNIKSSSSILNSSVLLTNKKTQSNISNNFTNKNNNNFNYSNNKKNSNSTNKNNNNSNNNNSNNNSIIEKNSLINSKIISENNEIGQFYMNSNNLNKSSENILKNTQKHKTKKSKIDSNLNSTLNEYYLKQTVNRNNLENYQTISGIKTVDKNGKKIEGSLLLEKEGLQSIFIKKMAHKPRINVRNDFLSENEKKIYANEIKKRDIVNVTKCENLLEKNLTRNFTPDMKPVRDRIKKRDMKIKKKKGIPQIEYKVDFDSIKRKNDQIELTKTLKFKQSLMNKSKNFNNNNYY